MRPDQTPDQTTPEETDFTRAEDAPQGTGSYGSGYGQADQPDTDSGHVAPGPPKSEDDTTEESEEVTEEELDESEDGQQPGSTPGTGIAGGPAY
jgi:hypothetical protein